MRRIRVVILTAAATVGICAGLADWGVRWFRRGFCECALAQKQTCALVYDNRAGKDRAYYGYDHDGHAFRVRSWWSRETAKDDEFHEYDIHIEDITDHAREGK